MNPANFQCDARVVPLPGYQSVPWRHIDRKYLLLTTDGNRQTGPFFLRIAGERAKSMELHPMKIKFIYIAI